ncbi:hypothetical protein HY213_05580 [Candidatus Peregrinibacteria bacterium]|nr:hypothetical protein [Candidatus Peregrinibacteria bacterium]
MLAPEQQPEEELERLFQKCRTFMRRLSGGRETDGFPHNRDEFVAWLNSLDPATRDDTLNDFERGYDGCVAQGEKGVAAVIARYDEEERAMH